MSPIRIYIRVVASVYSRAVRMCKQPFWASFPLGVNGRDTRATPWWDRLQWHICELL